MKTTKTFGTVTAGDRMTLPDGTPGRRIVIVHRRRNIATLTLDDGAEFTAPLSESLNVHPMPVGEGPTEEGDRRLAAACGFCWTYNEHTPECVEERARKDREAEARRWQRNRKTHSWMTLDGENFSCGFCDTKTGTEPCPEGMTDDGPNHDYRKDPR